MKRWFSSLKAKLSQPKWRHGRLGTLVMVLVIVVAVLLNISRTADEY